MRQLLDETCSTIEAKPIGCKWIFKIKRDSEGNVARYNAHLVAKGFTQREGIDFTETFSLVSSEDSFRIIMTLIAYFVLELHQMDVTKLFSKVTLMKLYMWCSQKTLCLEN